MSGLKKQQREFLRLIEKKSGVRFTKFEVTGGGHMRLHADGLSVPIFIPSTSSCKRGALNAASFVRRQLVQKAGLPC